MATPRRQDPDEFDDRSRDDGSGPFRAAIRAFDPGRTREWVRTAIALAVVGYYLSIGGLVLTGTIDGKTAAIASALMSPTVVLVIRFYLGGNDRYA